MKVDFDNIRQKLIDKTNAVMVRTWELRDALEREKCGSMPDTLYELDSLERLLDSLRDPVIAIGCLESDGSEGDKFEALDFDVNAARREDQE